MPAQQLSTEAFVIGKRPPGDGFQGLTLFSAENGTLLAMHRLAQKTTSGAIALDLFDEATVRLESSNQGRSWFLKEARLITRSAGIGRSYEALRFASALAALIARNQVDESSRSAVAALLRVAFEAFGAGIRPEIVYFKSLYRFVRDEGYPLKQQWFPTLPASDRIEVAVVLNRPLSDQTAPAATVARFQRRMEEYIRGHTEILLE